MYSVQIKHKGRRVRFALRTADKGEAAGRAQERYLYVVANGWDAALQKYKESEKPTGTKKPAKLGAWLDEVKATAGFRPSTLTTYAQSLRQIASEIEDVKEDPELDEDGKPKRDAENKIILRSRFDYKKGGRAAWVAKVDALPLSILSANAVQKWKLAYIEKAGNAPDARRRAENSAATLMRCARAVFSPKARKHASADLTLPEPLPFAGVELPKKGNTKYKSKIDAPALIEAARTELSGEPFKVFALGLLCGLRKREIDLLMWSQVDFTKGVLRVERTEHFQTKSEDSAGEIDIDAELLALLRGWKATTKGQFVIESKRPPRHDKSRTNYRAEKHFETLYAWLRGKGVTANKPLHELRKELGALLASEHGIFAAQSVLRHAQISTTAGYYADKKKRISVGLGSLLAPKLPNVVAGEFGGTDGAATEQAATAMA